MILFDQFLHEALLTLYDMAPIVIVILVFQLAVTHQRPARLISLLSGAFYIFIGLTLFRLGLSESLLPIGGLMAEQLIGHGSYLWLCAFAVMLGFSATLIEPTLIAVGERIRTLTGGGISSWCLRIVIAAGVAAGLLIGTLRILYGIPLGYILIPTLVSIGVLVAIAPRAIVPLALDSGGMATSVVTVPLITAFGITIADALPGRDPLLDGFGLILMALLFPMISMLLFALIQVYYRNAVTTEKPS